MGAVMRFVLGFRASLSIGHPHWANVVAPRIFFQRFSMRGSASMNKGLVLIDSLLISITTLTSDRLKPVVAWQVLVSSLVSIKAKNWIHANGRDKRKERKLRDA